MFPISDSNVRKRRIWRLLSIAVAVAVLGALLLPVPGMATQAIDPVISLTSKGAPACSDDENSSCASELFTVDFAHTASYEFDCHGNPPIPIPWLKIVAALFGVEIPLGVPDPTPETAICFLLAQGSIFRVYESGNLIVEETYIGLKHEGQFTVQPNHTYELKLIGHGRDFREIAEANGATFDSFANVTYQESDPPDESCQNPFHPDGLPYSGNLEFSGDHDWQQIKSPIKGTMVLTLDVPPDKDYQLEVMNDACSEVWVLSQNGTDMDERFVMPVDPVYYRIHVYGKTAEDWGESYTVSTKWDLDDNQWENASYFDMPYSGDLEYAGDHDWQRVQVPVGNTFLMLDVPEGKNYDLELWQDDAKVQLAVSANESGVDERILINEPGYYKIHIYGANPASDFDSPYRIFLFLDDTPPTTTIAITGTLGNNGWYRSPIEIALNATDNPDGTGVRKTEYGFSPIPDDAFSGYWYTYEEPLKGAIEGYGYLLYRSIDQVGNVEPYQMQYIKLDMTPPAIQVYSPQSMDYLHSATFVLLWKPFEKLSGLDTSSTMLDGQPIPNGQMVDPFFLNLGPHTVSIQATDNAGNTASLSIPFNVVADIDSLRAVTRRSYDLGWINKQSAYDTLDARLRAAEQSIDRGQYQTARRQLLAFLLQLRVYNGRSINQQAYDLLRTDALYVLLHLP